MKMKNLMRAVILTFIFIIGSGLISGCSDLKGIAVFWDHDETCESDSIVVEDTAEDRILLGEPANEIEALEYWNILVRDREALFSALHLINYLQQSARPTPYVDWNKRVSDTEDISAILDTLPKENIVFEKYQLGDSVLFKNLEERNIRFSSISVYLYNDEELADFGFSVAVDGYIYIHTSSSLDYVYRSAEPMTFMDLHLVYLDLLAFDEQTQP